jgi:hypothetical protein
MRGRRIFAAVVVVAAVSVVPATANGAELVARNANNIELAVSADGKALVTY